MFGTGLTQEQVEAIEKSQIEVAATLGAIIQILLEKNVCTLRDLERLKTAHIAMCDQEMQRQREELNREFDEKHPGLRNLFGKFTGIEQAGGK